MSDDDNYRLTRIFLAMDTKLKEIRSTNYVKSEENFKNLRQKKAYEVHSMAEYIRNSRLRGNSARSDWHTEFSDSQLYEWAMSSYDCFLDLLADSTLPGTSDRLRLRDVTPYDVETRIALLERVIEERRAWFNRPTKRERIR